MYFGNYPESLEELILETDSLPPLSPSLKHLTLGNDFNQQILPNTLPIGLIFSI